MIVAVTIGIVILCLLIWLPIDFYFGRRSHINNVFKRDYPKRNSDIQLYTSGKALFRDLFTEIQNAERHVHILFFIVSNDRFSQAFLHLLKEKAQSGVEVRLMVDRIGSHKINKKTVLDLEAYGVSFNFARRLKFPYLFYSLNERNHRKITIIDGKVGYIGGYNVGKEYIDQDSKLNPWRDYHLKVEGEGVRDLQDEFLADWYHSSGVDDRSNRQYFPPLRKGKCLHQLIPTEGIFLEKTFSRLISGAGTRIIIGTPYFIPSRQLFLDLRTVLSRGIDLTIIVPKMADHPFVQEASYPYFRLLLKEGAKVLQYDRGFYHSKIMLIDDKICDIGTANFDRRSLFLNHEMNCLIFDPLCIEMIKKELKSDIDDSTPLTLEMLSMPNPIRRIKESIAFVISPFL
ncbi:cardiolipin synthase [Peribacillus cavernae]|uniref:Cardiolipin synthase n=1 Tax=Peribacillus cavernae TaxID=1674310 RepID=A0A3S1BA49_9BACI|nr:cardiolipin synthase [Peribacillus cavernae]MDQ0218544.1 cardiolipin synthase [Peribacillus cavernae]RUQ31534.1 cardiolipin synthase [Peribacillus cavernae]